MHATTCNVSNWTGLIAAFNSGSTAVLCGSLNDANQSNYMQLGVAPGHNADLDLNGWTLKITNVPAGAPGIKVPVGANLTIGDSTLTRLGRLTVTGGSGTVGGGGGAGIGGVGGIGAIVPTQGTEGTAAGTVTMTGGTVLATGGAGSNNPVHGAGGGGGGAGIGGGGAGAGDGPHFNTHVTGGNGGTLNLTGGYLKSVGGAAGMAGPFGEPGSAGGAGIGGGGGAGTGRGKYASGNGGTGGPVHLIGGSVNSVGGTGGEGAPLDPGGGGAGIGAGGGGPYNSAAGRTGGNITVVPGTVRVVDSGPGTGGDDQSSQNGQEPQQVMLTSNPPSDPNLGGTYRVTAISTFGASGQPIVFSTPATNNACALEVDAETVTFTRTGICTIDANQAGSNGYGYETAPTATQSFTVQPADHPDPPPSSGTTGPLDRAAPPVPASLLGGRPRVSD